MDKSGIDLILLLLYRSKDYTIFGTTRLEKLLFLLLYEGEFEKTYKDFDFKAYNYGPWSAKVLDYVELLNDEGLVTTTTQPASQTINNLCLTEFENELTDEESNENKIRIYNLTIDGSIVGKHLFLELNDNLKEKLDRIIIKYSSFKNPELIEYVYKNFDFFTSESLIRKQVLGMTPEEEFKEKHPGIQIDSNLYKIGGILPKISIEEEKKLLRKVAIERL